jgi:hypothetical protein
MPHALHVQAELINLNNTARPTPASAPDTLEPRVLGRLKLPISLALTLKALTLAPARTPATPATAVASTPTPPTTRAEAGRAEAARAGAHVGHVKLGHTRVALSRTKGVARDEVRTFPLQSVAEASPSAAAVPRGAGRERAPGEEEEERAWSVELQLCFRLAVSLDSIHTHAVTIDCSGGGELVCEEEEELKMDRVKEHHTKQQVFAQNEDTKEKVGHVKEEEEESLEGNSKTVAKKKSDGVKKHEVGGGGAGAGVQGDEGDDGGKARRFRQLLAMVCSGRGAAAAYRLLPLPTAGEAAIRAR